MQVVQQGQCIAHHSLLQGSMGCQTARMICGRNLDGDRESLVAIKKKNHLSNRHLAYNSIA